MDTTQRILDAAERRMMTGGFHSFSYKHIAEDVGIRKASIHYHFPSKTDLGRAVIQRYREKLETLLEEIDSSQGYWEAFDSYLIPFRQVQGSEGLVCLCGALAGEYPSLSAEMQTEVTAFFQGHHTWLTQLFEKGRKEGVFRFEDPAEKLAKLCFSALQGALLVHRAIGEPDHLETVVEQLKRALQATV